MSAPTELSFQQRSLFQQGYQSYSAAELKQLDWGLRFTPSVCSAITAVGLVLQLPWLLFAVSLLGMWAFFAPAAHPMDLIYNHGVRHLFGAVALPPNPLQRRLACLAAGVMNATAAVLFLMELPIAALVVGGMLLVLQAIVITTHFCTLSYMYEGIMRMLGQWHVPISEADGQKLLAEGVTLVDVRGRDEFERGAIDGAINLPVDDIENHAQDLKGIGSILLYCRSGMRSQIAAEKLRTAGVSGVFDGGSMARIERMKAVA